jgi:hypothetical protein
VLTTLPRSYWIVLYLLLGAELLLTGLVAWREYKHRRYLDTNHDHQECE